MDELMAEKEVEYQRYQEQCSRDLEYLLQTLAFNGEVTRLSSWSDVEAKVESSQEGMALEASGGVVEEAVMTFISYLQDKHERDVSQWWSRLQEPSSIQLCGLAFSKDTTLDEFLAAALQLEPDLESAGVSTAILTDVFSSLKELEERERLKLEEEVREKEKAFTAALASVLHRGSLPSTWAAAADMLAGYSFTISTSCNT